MGERRAPSRAPSEARIRRMFDDIVVRYDLLSDLLSFGFDRWWRREAAGAVAAPPGSLVLDLGCGTGRLGERLAGRHRMVGVDVSMEMLRACRARLGGRFPVVQGSAFALPFADGTFGGAVSAFVLRNLADFQAAFAECARVLVAGASVSIVDSTEPRNQLWRKAFDAYFSVAPPLLGRLSASPDVYVYLSRSLAQLPPPKEVSAQMTAAGFRTVRHRVLPPGMVTLWTARRG
jgi:demethylmenaquinone methyltransferase / 2-methoxy-6-polyprenyl-1,4-benzoquinol methylase